MVKQGLKGSGTLYQHDNGYWIGQLQVNGQRRTVSNKSKAEAKKKLEELCQKATRHGHLPEKHTLFALLDRFIEIGKSSWKPRTVNDYERVTAMTKKEVGDKPLDKITPASLQSLYLLFKPRRALYVHQVLHRAFVFAVKWGWLYDNPCDKVFRPGYKPQRREIWTLEECRHFLDNTSDSHFYPLFVTAIMTGCRFGELAGLRWTDINFERKTLTIERSLQRIKGECIETTPKTNAGRRTIRLEDTAIQALHNQKVKQTEWQLKAPQWHNTAGRIFTRQDGKPLSESAVIHSLANLCRKLELPKITLHDLRHIHASLALQAGAPLPLVSKQLGHANANITATVYSHAITDGGLVTAAVKKALRG